MKGFTAYLNAIQEIGYVEQVTEDIIHVSGLPSVKPEEVVIFETGDIGQVFSIESELVEVMLFSKNLIKPGTRAARTDEVLNVPVGFELLGQVINPLGNRISVTKSLGKPKESRPVNSTAPGIAYRKTITKPLETGILIVDSIIPLGHGQRELVIGDRKTGKTNFLEKAAISQVQKGNICIYATIGKKRLDVKSVEEFFIKNGVMDKIVIVASGSEDAAGLIYLTPYTAMTISEYFRDQGKDVLLILDDLSTHAKFYREISLLGRRFPGRSSYPSDIFYTHAKLLERAGNFQTKKGEYSITCLPVAETTQGDFSGYIETNLVSMTDGHLYFDIDLFYQGRRPAINPFISVTRVGRQTQSPLRREISREIISFLSLYERMQTFIHFGAELNENIKATLATGDKMIQFFNYTSKNPLPINLQIIFFAMLWADVWQKNDETMIEKEMEKLITAYKTDKKLQDMVDRLAQLSSFNNLLKEIKEQSPQILRLAAKYGK